jgi:hypothetical protein
MVFMDNGDGGAIINGGLEADKVVAKMNNITIWGETNARECLAPNACVTNGSLQGCVDRMGLMLPYFKKAAPEPMPTMPEDIPIFGTDKDAAWGG